MVSVIEFIREYDLIRPDDRVLVAVSGGKDSTVLLFKLQEFFNVEAVTIDPHIPDYTDINLKNISDFCSRLGVKLHVVSLKEKTGFTLQEIKERHPNLTYCSICGILKRYYLNQFAKDYDVVATGHNCDDCAQSILMNMMRGNMELNARMGPVSGVREQEGFTKRVKPFFMTMEKDIKAFSKEHSFPVHYGSCPFSREAYRKKVRNLLWDYEEKHPGTMKNIVKQFLSFYPALKEKYQGSPGVCKRCKAPSNQEICSACRLLEKL